MSHHRNNSEATQPNTRSSEATEIGVYRQGEGIHREIESGDRDPDHCQAGGSFSETERVVRSLGAGRTHKEPAETAKSWQGDRDGLHRSQSRRAECHDEYLLAQSE